MKLSAIAQHLGGRLEGPDLEISQLNAPEQAKAGDLVVVREAKFLAAALASGAALVVEEGLECPPTTSLIRVEKASKVWPHILALFDQPTQWAESGIHPTAVIEEGAWVDSTASVGAFVVVAGGAKVEAGAVLAPHCYIGENAVVGEGSVLEPRVTLYRNSSLGKKCHVATGAVLGAVGFGFQEQKRLPHTGKVVLEDGVEIGANCVIQRSVVGETRIGAFSKIGDLTNMGHNAQIGKNVVMVGSSAIGGSVVIGDNVLMGGWVVISDHVRIEQGAIIAGGSGISKTVPAGQTWASGLPAQPIRQHWRRLALLDWLVRMERQLKQMFKANAED
jgi:UDP-3-O-[3-hydroxymyristoyl] glucosamine N-acyltransferase